MRFDDILISGTLRRRYKRFLADVCLDDGREVTAHCPNTGSMQGLSAPGSRVMLSPQDNPKRKLAYTLELVRVGRAWVGVHTGRANGIVAEAITNGSIPELGGYPTLRREVAYGKNSRVDILLEDGARKCYVEVKNATLARDGIAFFPDAVTLRGQKHIRELTAMMRQGHRAVLLFLVHRSDCSEFRPADWIDPDYATMLREAVGNGLEVLPYACRVGPKIVSVSKRLPSDLG